MRGLDRCVCGECEEDQVYICVGCKLEMPYCLGQDDQYFEYCDDCAYELIRDEESAQSIPIK